MKPYSISNVVQKQVVFFLGGGMGVPKVRKGGIDR